VSREDFYASPFGAAYSACMERPRIGRVIGRIVWGGDSRTYYESMSAIAEVPDGGTIVDCPCGAGPALRALRAGRPIRYVAVDLSPAMLRRARARAKERGLEGIEFLPAEATEIPLADATADLFLSFWGLHCFPEPAAALAEAGRIVKPGGRLVGASLLRGNQTLRQRLLVRPHVGDFGPIGTEEEIRDWIGGAGFEAASFRRSGPMLFFDASLAAAPATV
jgi:SAM-dependent methyltransferase